MACDEISFNNKMTMIIMNYCKLITMTRCLAFKTFDKIVTLCIDPTRRHMCVSWMKTKWIHDFSEKNLAISYVNSSTVVAWQAKRRYQSTTMFSCLFTLFFFFLVYSNFLIKILFWFEVVIKNEKKLLINH